VRHFDNDELPDDWTGETQASIKARGVPPREWIVRGMIEADDAPVLLFGKPGAFKSWVALHISMCVATGLPVFDQFPVLSQRKAFYLNFDSGRNAFARRMTLLDPRTELFECASPDQFDFKTLDEFMKRHAGWFVCLDCFANLYVPDLQQEQGADMRAFGQPLRRLYEKYGCSGIVIDHARRQRDADGDIAFYGSTQKEAVFRQMWSVAKVKQRDRTPGTGRLTLHCHKMSEVEEFKTICVGLDWTETSFSATFVPPDDDDEAVDRVSDAYDKIVDALRDSAEGLSRQELCMRTGLHKKVVLEALKRTGIEKVHSGRSRKYVLADSHTSTEDSFVPDSFPDGGDE
jgi:hypothetical protein